jgi:ADP-heptose:LPS heptosyltransferase/SAM-dependent methyltransferase
MSIADIAPALLPSDAKYDSPRRLVLRSFQSPGDVVMLTAAVRDLHLAHPGKFQTDVRTSADALWENNPYVVKLKEHDRQVESLDMHYPLIHDSDRRPYHFIHGYVQYLEERLGVRIPLTRFGGDIHLSADEKCRPSPVAALGHKGPFWIVMAGGKHDFTAKWWNPASYQAVVDHFQGKIRFVQCGEAGHFHPRLSGAIDLVGKTSLREFILWMHHADGVLCPVTLAMHLAAAVETRPGKPPHRACVVVAGGREPAHWEQYPQHQFLSTVGMLPCCLKGACWRSRCQLVGDGDAKDRQQVCERPVQVTPELRIPRCQEMIAPDDVIRRIEGFYEEGILEYLGGTAPHAPIGNGHNRLDGEPNDETPQAAAAKSGEAAEETPASETPAATGSATKTPTGMGSEAQEEAATVPTEETELPAGKKPDVSTPVLIDFQHGLGDAVQLTTVLLHLRHYHPEWQIDVLTGVGKHTCYQGLCHRSLIRDRDPIDRSAYAHVYELHWDECPCCLAAAPSTKAEHCLRTVFHLEPIAALCRYQIEAREAARTAARAYLAAVCGADAEVDGRFPAVLIHYEANTSIEKKNLPHELIASLCDTVLDAGFTPIILDWDRRSPLPDGVRIHNPNAEAPLWGGTGTGDAEALAALIEMSSLMIGVDSGPLHVAAATRTPTIGVWTGHHPLHYMGLADNVTHLVPEQHASLLRCGAALGAHFFENRYQTRAYRQLNVDLPALAMHLLTGEDVEQQANKQFLRQLKTTAYDERYYAEHRAAGLDYLVFGRWQQEYGRWVVESLGLREKRLLDVSCACGSILRGLGEAGAVVEGVDLCEAMVRRGREQWPDMAGLLFVCDAINLHLFADGAFDAIHSAQAAEHWKPELVPFILRELWRVTKPGGLFFCALDTAELFERQKRDIEHEDPTHVCIRPLAWWHDQLAASGWQECSAQFDPRLRSHPENFLNRYDWDWFVARKLPEAQQ